MATVDPDPADGLAETAATVRRWLGEGRRVAVGRVVAIQGFSTWPGDELVAVDGGAAVAGAVLGAPGTAQLRHAMVEVLERGESHRRLTVEIHGRAVIEAGLSCGGQAEVLVQDASALPAGLWAPLAERVAVALVGAPERPEAAVVHTAAGGGEATGPALALAAEALAAGHSAVRRELVDGAEVLVEAWVPPPRLVVVGDGDLVGALTSQAGLLGWATTNPGPGGLDEALAWAGGTAAVVVLSHDPHVDVPALRAALDGGAGYVGAMGSRRTQSRRLDRLRSEGVSEADLGRIHRPIGLDLGGRSAPEVALAICAEVLAVRTGRAGGPLRDRSGPIHDR